MAAKATVEELKQFKLFRKLETDELRYLAQNLEAREYKKDEVIYREKDIPSVLYLVQKGGVEITKMVPTGHRQVISIILSGQFFGELSFFESRRHAAQARATADCKLLLLHRFVYDEIEKAQPLLAHKLLKEIILILGKNLDNMNDTFLEIINFAFYSAGAGKIENPEQED
ncbi:MAG TPA: cyclic nucleotide-binding domain-containing protein [Nitrospiria bacterium]|nr:cyclic nucleotide-binding domain-containing protein [Nitrospiria bacterium]